MHENATRLGGMGDWGAEGHAGMTVLGLWVGLRWWICGWRAVVGWGDSRTD